MRQSYLNTVFILVLAFTSLVATSPASLLQAKSKTLVLTGEGAFNHTESTITARDRSFFGFPTCKENPNDPNQCQVALWTQERDPKDFFIGWIFDHKCNVKGFNPNIPHSELRKDKGWEFASELPFHVVLWVRETFKPEGTYLWYNGKGSYPFLDRDSIKAGYSTGFTKAGNIVLTMKFTC